MSREINPPLEILRRFLFVLCVAGLLSSSLYLLIAVAGSRWPQIINALLAVTISVLFFLAGNRFFNFSGLARSFPTGEQEEDIPDTLKTETVNLLQDIANPHIDWMTRHELRKKLAGIIRQEPRLLDLYGKEIRNAHPFFSGKPLKNNR
jgi:hypothetical protein